MSAPLLLTRRDVLAWLALVPAGVTASAVGPTEIRIATAGDLNEDERRGIEFGVREATQTARLLGATVRTTVQRGSATAPRFPRARAPGASWWAGRPVGLNGQGNDVLYS
jgi:hypothetical protein